MNFFKQTGKMALGSRLRLLTMMITDDAAKIFELYNVQFSPKWFPVFFVLSKNEEKTITEIATEIRHSQPSVTKLIKEMRTAGLVQDNLKTTDKRQNLAALTPKGKELSVAMKAQYTDVDTALDSLIAEADHNLWEAIAEWEQLLEEKSLFERVQEQKKRREIQDVQIVDYTASYQLDFKTLNEAWISVYFEMEEVDYKALDNPQSYILDKGGKIFVALHQNEVVGVCALIKMEDSKYDFELAKMAVSPQAQGKKIGWLLGLKVIEAAKTEGATRLYLESNTVLKPAINLYYKLGFKKVSGIPTPYKRCNIQMELVL